MKRRKLFMVGLFLVFLTGNTLAQNAEFNPPNPPEPNSAQENVDNQKGYAEIANDFRTSHISILSKTIDDVAISDITSIEEALKDYDELSDAVKELLESEKVLLDSLKAKAEALKVTEENFLSTADVTAKANSTVLIPVLLTNKVDVYGVQCDIYLSSDKISLTKDTKGRYVFTQNTDRVEGQTASSKLQSDGSVRYLLADYTAENPFTGNDGELFYISIDIPGDLEGEHTVNIRNITLATDEKKILCPDIVSKITVMSYTLGDVDDDGTIDVQDVLRTAQLVLNSSYNIAADMDEDGLIDVQDVIMVAKAVLEQE